MNNPLVSVVMASYNEEAFIGEAIDSVLHQSFDDFEFIIINDGSTDKTESIILSYTDKRIKYIKNDTNIKLIASLNKGLTLAQGKYIARMDADDICELNRFQKQVEFMEANPEIGISGAQLSLFGKETGFMNYPLTHEEIKLRLFVTSSFGNNVVIFRRDIMEKNQLYFPKGYIHAEDFKCWTNWVLLTKTANLDVDLVRYRSHQNSVSFKNRTLQRETRNRIRAEYVCSIFDLGNHSEVANIVTGKISLKKVRAISTILKLNLEKKIFENEKLKEILFELWYLDSLEEAENNFFVTLKYPFIFRLGLKGNLKRWLFIGKHYLKQKN